MFKLMPKKILTIKLFFLLQWTLKLLSSRVLVSRSWGCGFEPHKHHCVVFLSKTQMNPCLVLAQPRRPHSHTSEKNVDWGVKNKI